MRTYDLMLFFANNYLLLEDIFKSFVMCSKKCTSASLNKAFLLLAVLKGMVRHSVRKNRQERFLTYASFADGP